MSLELRKRPGIELAAVHNRTRSRSDGATQGELSLQWIIKPLTDTPLTKTQGHG